MSSVNAIMNKVHELGQPEQLPIMRLGMTRVWSAACVPLELVAALFAPWQIGKSAVKYLSVSFNAAMHGRFPDLRFFKSTEDPAVYFQELSTACTKAAKVIAGLASTILFGIILCPEVNFRLHLQLELAVDNFTIKKQKELEARLEADKLAQVIAEARTKRFEEFKTNLNAQWTAERAEIPIDDRIAGLILRSC